MNIEDQSFIAKTIEMKLLIIDYREKLVKKVSIQNLIIGPFLTYTKTILLG